MVLKSIKSQDPHTTPISPIQSATGMVLTAVSGQKALIGQWGLHAALALAGSDGGKALIIKVLIVESVPVRGSWWEGRSQTMNRPRKAGQYPGVRNRQPGQWHGPWMRRNGSGRQDIGRTMLFPLCAWCWAQRTHLQGKEKFLPRNTYFGPRSAETSSHPHFRGEMRCSSNSPSGHLAVPPRGQAQYWRQQKKQ